MPWQNTLDWMRGAGRRIAIAAAIQIKSRGRRHGDAENSRTEVVRSGWGSPFFTRPAGRELGELIEDTGHAARSLGMPATAALRRAIDLACLAERGVGGFDIVGRGRSSIVPKTVIGRPKLMPRGPMREGQRLGTEGLDTVTDARYREAPCCLFEMSFRKRSAFRIKLYREPPTDALHAVAQPRTREFGARDRGRGCPRA